MAKSKSVKAKAKKTVKAKAVKDGVTHASLMAIAVSQYDDNVALIKRLKLPIRRPTSNYISKPHGERMNKLRAQIIAEAKKSEGKPQRKPRARAAKAEQHASA